ncbi:amidohydrolase family protein [Acrocarpospora catenulata]|uniref:amidohydrolase family protein n=1 Tax=Acrocarpospora catenulata TaxID=2836182 RepID=UPI001BDB615B|nr:amidohydrolase family protein [Acrocarpospora catenulata]
MGTTALTGARVIDGRGAAPVDDQTILIEDDRIASVGPGGVPAGVTPDVVIDLHGQTVTPGLIDMHVHTAHPIADSEVWGGRMGRYLSADELAVWSMVNARRAIRAGLTTVRDVGCATDSVFALRRLTGWDVTLGPRVLAAGQLLCITGGHGHQLFGYECDGVDEATKGARLQLKRGADLIKLCATGGAATKHEKITENQFTRAEMTAIVEVAHERGKRVAAHAHATSGIKAAIEAGVDTIDHGVILDDEAVAMMAEAGTYLVPTLSIYPALATIGPSKGLEPHAAEKGAQVAEIHQASLWLAHQAGVKIAFGTDAAGPYHLIGGPGVLRAEFELMAGAGMTPLEVFQAATSVSAEALGLEAEIGAVEPGKIADLVVYPGDPLTDLDLIDTPAMVFRGGTLCGMTESW